MAHRTPLMAFQQLPKPHPVSVHPGAAEKAEETQRQSFLNSRNSGGFPTLYVTLCTERRFDGDATVL